MIDRDEFSAWFPIARDARRGARLGPVPCWLISALPRPRSGRRPARARRSFRPWPPTALADVPPEVQARLDAALAWLDGAEHDARDAIVIGNPRYPQSLARCAPMPPCCSTCRGEPICSRRRRSPSSAAANPTAQGIENARAFAEYLSRAGFTIVSGLALGIDGAAHDGALGGAGKTIAVVGTGLDRVYPARHRALARRIAAEGLIVSEFAIGTPALPPHFPIRKPDHRRARARHARRRGRGGNRARSSRPGWRSSRAATFFAIPGSIHSPQSRGCHALIKQGAKLVDSARDIVDELAPPTTLKAAASTPAATPTSTSTRRHQCERLAARRARLRPDRSRRAHRPHRPQRGRALGAAARPRARRPRRAPARPALPAGGARLSRFAEATRGLLSLPPIRAGGSAQVAAV